MGATKGKLTVAMMMEKNPNPDMGASSPAAVAIRKMTAKATGKRVTPPMSSVLGDHRRLSKLHLAAIDARESHIFVKAPLGI
jgi:hypothetical protein